MRSVSARGFSDHVRDWRGRRGGHHGGGEYGEPPQLHARAARLLNKCNAQWKAKFNLPDAHVEYLRSELLEAWEQSQDR
jgi:hypothetical protein